MSAFKIPGFDGFPPSFFKHYWHIVGKQVIEAVTYFFSTALIKPAINHSFIALIPKTRMPIPWIYSDPLACAILLTKPSQKSWQINSSLSSVDSFSHSKWLLSLVTGASWVWQDIVKCAKVLQFGACFSVSVGSALRIWEDPWIPTLPSFKPLRPPVLTHSWPMLVRDLIDHNTYQSNLEVLSEMFTNPTIKEIKKIQIPVHVEPSRPFWAPSKSGKFSVKTVFRAIQLSELTPNHEDETLGKKNLEENASRSLIPPDAPRKSPMENGFLHRWID
ncbi:UNVERIFIED_CONTAM: hypothetical protein Scaly_2984100 [Sesamum calycinum]|uniref:Uncharacterized protein n=1 Tax=Sesamum calycinum TaxID=2727403 RepID=A0AAW2KM38_9LAMI